MSDRMTMKDVNARLDVLRSVAVRAGITTHERAARWEVSTPSKTYGNTARLYQIGADEPPSTPNDERYPFGTGHYSAAGLPDFLGWSCREACDVLSIIITTLYAVIDGNEA